MLGTRPKWACHITHLILHHKDSFKPYITTIVKDDDPLIFLKTAKWWWFLKQRGNVEGCGKGQAVGRCLFGVSLSVCLSVCLSVSAGWSVCRSVASSGCHNILKKVRAVSLPMLLSEHLINTKQIFPKPIKRPFTTGSPKPAQCISTLKWIRTLTSAPIEVRLSEPF